MQSFGCICGHRNQPKLNQSKLKATRVTSAKHGKIKRRRVKTCNRYQPRQNLQPVPSASGAKNMGKHKTGFKVKHGETGIVSRAEKMPTVPSTANHVTGSKVGNKHVSSRAEIYRQCRPSTINDAKTAKTSLSFFFF